MSNNLLIVVASWEDRFALGIKRSLADDAVDTVICLASRRYVAKTQEARKHARYYCENANVKFDERMFDFEDQIESYRVVGRLVQEGLFQSADNVTLDLSTAPRSLVWMLLGAVKPILSQIMIRYYTAAHYDSWQTAEEGEPRLIINRSGIMYPDKPTCLVMLCGPEISRAEKMFYRFEPRKTLVLRDTRAHEFGDIKRLPEEYGDSVEERLFDNKDLTHDNIIALEGILKPYLASHNIVAASLGPKIGALLLFKVSDRYEQIGLSYVTSGKHNLSATKGIGSVLNTVLSFAAD